MFTLLDPDPEVVHLLRLHFPGRVGVGDAIGQEKGRVDGILVGTALAVEVRGVVGVKVEEAR